MRTPSFLFSGEKLLYQRRESSSYFLEIEGIFQLCPRKYFTHTKYIAWCCSTHIKSKDECSMLFIREERIRQAFITMMNKLNFGYSYVLTPLSKQLETSNQEDRKSTRLNSSHVST